MRLQQWPQSPPPSGGRLEGAVSELPKSSSAWRLLASLCPDTARVERAERITLDGSDTAQQSLIDYTFVEDQMQAATHLDITSRVQRLAVFVIQPQRWLRSQRIERQSRSIT